MRGSEYTQLEGLARDAQAAAEVEAAGQPTADATAAAEAEAAPAAVLDADAGYRANRKALQKWAQERLTLRTLDDGSVDALFRFEGSTCSNMGRTLRFDYRVKIGPRRQGYPILEQHCGPTPGDEGYTHMCRYMNNAEHLMVAIDQEKPLLGRPLNGILTWERAATGASCYCEGVNRKHMWGLVLETIHFAMAQREAELATRIQAGVTGGRD